MFNNIKERLNRLPFIRRKTQEILRLQRELLRWRTWQEPGHFYSPIPNLVDIRHRQQTIFDRCPDSIPAIDLNTAKQLELLKALSEYYHDLPFTAEENPQFRYHFKNPYYSFADGIILYSMLRNLRPRQLIEIGSGYSSAVVLDTNEHFLNQSVRCTFIEPYPERLRSLICDDDVRRIEILSCGVQDVALNHFQALQRNDILLIDSSHVAKTGSDVNHLLFEVLPILQEGVYVHFHDIFFPFEYPRDWILNGVAWNEAYALHAFLQYNETFEIVFYTSYLLKQYSEVVGQLLPLALESECPEPTLNDAPGASLWLRKTRS